MRIHDISTLIEPEMQVWKDNPNKKPVYEITATHEKGVSHETKVTLDIHCGTHIDMPLHMIKDGKAIDTFDFKRLITKCKVFDMTYLEKPVISVDDIKDLNIEKDDFIIFRTKNSLRDPKLGFDPEFVFVDESAAGLLKNLEVNGVGIDALGIERSQAKHSTHKLLLEDDIIIMEGLSLRNIQEGPYELIALPIKLKGTEGSWVRAVLIEN